MACQFLIFIMLLIQTYGDEKYLTINEMKGLMKFEQELGNLFLNYYHRETKRLDKIEKKLNEIENVHKKKKTDAASHLTDSYRLLNRFLTDWRELDWLFSPNSTKEELEYISFFTDRILAFEDSSELRGAIHTIIRLQETYNITTAEMAKGLRPPAHHMTAENMHEVAMYASHFYNYPAAVKWAKHLVDTHPTDTDFSLGDWEISESYELLAWAEYKTRNYIGALEATKKSNQLKPSDKKKQNMLWYQTYIYYGDNGENPAPEILPDDSENNRTYQSMLCRREFKLDPAIASTLFCSYYTPHPQFILKPLKHEQVFHDPKLDLYHNILSEVEIEHIKELARVKLQSAEVYSMKSGKLTKANYRISKNAWLLPRDDRIVRRVINRVGALANMDMSYSEPLQVANYGIGGNYEAHFDFASPPHNSSIFGAYDFGNRIATMLFYFETVEKGGDTTFVNIAPGVATQPIKGNGIFWHNLKRNGKGNKDTKHAACPVLLGEKWVSNLWIHENGQEFRHKCSLNPDE